MLVAVGEIRVNRVRRGLDNEYVRKLADSIRELGLMNPLTVDKDHALIAGLHRLEAVRLLGWTDVECTVSSLEGLMAEMAEIDENIVRKDLSAVEYGEILLRRKEIYEALHPESRHGMRNGQTSKNDKMTFLGTKSFAQDTAEKLGVARRTVERQIQTAKNLTPEAKEILKNSGRKLSKRNAMKISRLAPEQQKEAAALFAEGEIQSVDTGPPEPDKRSGAAAGSVEKAEREKEPHELQAVPGELAIDKKADLKKVIAGLKDPNKDCSGTPESFLEEYAAFVNKFHREIAWYSDPYFDEVYPLLDEGQVAELRRLSDSICSAAEHLYEEIIERTGQNGQ